MLTYDMTEISFSRRGSYMAFSYYPAEYRDFHNLPGIFLRNVHGDAGNHLVSRLVPLYDGQEIDYTYTASPVSLQIHTKHGQIELCFADEDTVLVEGQGDKLGLRFSELSDGSGYNFIHEVPYAGVLCRMVNCTKTNRRYLTCAQQGVIRVHQDWTVERTSYCEMDILAEDGRFSLVWEELATDWKSKEYHLVPGDCKARVEQEFNRFYQSMPSVPACYETAREKAAYVNWMSFVKPCGFLTREAMLMSKNGMLNVWSWDHCFNAMALAYENPKEAWDQWMILFDHQDAMGVMPDSINDSYIIRSFCKPPIHGWALRKMMRVMALSNEQVNEAYDHLAKWTNWWFNYRDHDGDGICEYYHGNDSGWDNSTAFRQLPPVELPDLSAFLIVQMDVLADLALRLGRQADAVAWTAKADRTLEAMLAHCFEEGRPKALLSRSHEEVENDSLILYLPIVLGKRLPEEIRRALVRELKSDRFYTAYGFATESPVSERYLSDGYWRGPIWAPSSMIVIDGLYESGEIDFAKEATNRFCALIEQSGCAENFDALTGEGLRDRAYTWTSSAFLVMAHEFLGGS